jgi:hypothetical protein
MSSPVSSLSLYPLYLYAIFKFNLIHSLFINQENRCNTCDGCSLTSQTLSLLSGNHQFECYKSEGHCSFTWSLTLEFQRISRGVHKLIRTSTINNKKK